MLARLDARVARLEQDFSGLKAENDRQTADLKEIKEGVAGLVDAWQTAAGVVKFVRWLSGLAIAIGAIWAAAKGLTLVRGP